MATTDRPRITICPPMAADGAWFDSPFSHYPLKLSEQMRQQAEEEERRLAEEESYD